MLTVTREVGLMPSFYRWSLRVGMWLVFQGHPERKRQSWDLKLVVLLAPETVAQ